MCHNSVCLAMYHGQVCVFLWALESTSPNASWEHHKGPSHGHLALRCPLVYPGSIYSTKCAFLEPAFCYPIVCEGACVFEGQKTWELAFSFCLFVGSTLSAFTHRATILPAQCRAFSSPHTGHTFLRPGAQIL